MSKKNPMAKLSAPDIIQHMKAKQEMEHQVFTYFHYDSDLFKAIRDHIAGADRSEKRECAFFPLPDDMEIPWHRGTGPSIHFKSAMVHGDDYSTRQSKSISFTRKIATLIILPNMGSGTISRFLSNWK